MILADGLNTGIIGLLAVLFGGPLSVFVGQLFLRRKVAADQVAGIASASNAAAGAAKTAIELNLVENERRIASAHAAVEVAQKLAIEQERRIVRLEVLHLECQDALTSTRAALVDLRRIVDRRQQAEDGDGR